MPNIEFFTGFEGCGNTADCRVMIDTMNFFIGGHVQYDATRGWDNGKCLRVFGTNGVYAREGQITQTVSVASKTKCVGFHVRGIRADDTYRNSVRPMLRIYLADGSSISLRNNAAGVWVLRDSTNIAQASETIPGGAEISGHAPIHHVEVKLVSHPTAGYVGIKLDGVSILDQGSLNTGDSNISYIAWSTNAYADGRNVSWDNLFIADDWVGEMRSVMLKPNVDDAVQFTPDTGTDNFDRIDDTAPDGDVSYVESGTVNHKDIYEFEDLPLGLIPMVATYVVNARKTDVGPRTLSMRAVQDATTYNLEERPLAIEYPNTHFAGLIDTLTLCPDGTAWDRDKLNAVKWGFEITE